MTDPINDRPATHRRFEQAVRAALNTPPKPRKSMTPKRTKAQRKGRKPKPSAASAP